LVGLHIALHRHCGVRYNADKIGVSHDAPFTIDDMSVAAAIHGKGGTCATLPIIYVAVGRRLGYPLKLALGKAHLICRWEDPDSGKYYNLGVSETPNIHSDDYYRNWPEPMSAEEESYFGYLKTLTPQQEHAHMLCMRGWVWETHGEFGKAAEAFAYAAELDTPWPRYTTCLRRAIRAWADRLYGARWFDRLAARPPQIGPRRWPNIHFELEATYSILANDEATAVAAGRRATWNVIRPR
jgi:hypothetical protein